MNDRIAEMVRASSSKQTDPSLLAPAWGALWGIALGTWMLVPDIVEAHHIRPENATQWAVILAALVVIFALMGAFLAFVGGFVLALIEQLTLGRFRDRVWAYGLFTGILVIIGYGLEYFVIQLVTYQMLDTQALYSDDMKALVLFALLTSACVMVAYWVITRFARHLTPIVLAVALIATGAAGAIAAVPRSGVDILTNADVGPLLKRSTESADVPLLFIGVDGATWRVLGPAIERGLAPTFRSIVERGTSGNVEALWPPYWSGAAWASILTGLPRETTGVYEDLAALAPGLPPFQVPLLSSLKLNPMYTVRAYLRAAGVISLVPPPRALLTGKPVWQLLQEAGVSSAVIRFRFTYPPTDADVMVSDWVGNDSWEQMGVRHRTSPDAVAPSDFADQLLAPFRTNTEDQNLFERLIPGPLPNTPADAVLEPFEYLRASADADERTFDVSMAVLKRNPKQPFMAVYFDGLDSAEHAFWQYRFPEDYTSNPPSPEDVKRFAPVIDRYIQFIDERLKALLALYQQEPNVVIVSDHGHGPSVISAGWRGWHTKEGIFLAAGPSVPKTRNRIAVSYYDILPTLVSLKGLGKPTALGGEPLFRQRAQEVVTNGNSR